MSDENDPTLCEPKFIRIGDKMINVAYANKIALVDGHLEVTVGGLDRETTYMLHEDAEAVFQSLQRFSIN